MKYLFFYIKFIWTYGLHALTLIQNSNSKLYIKSLHITLHISLHMCLHMLCLYASQVIKNNMMPT